MITYSLNNDDFEGTWIPLSAKIKDVLAFLDARRKEPTSEVVGENASEVEVTVAGGAHTEGDSDAGKANVTEGSRSPEGRAPIPPASETELEMGKD